MKSKIFILFLLLSGVQMFSQDCTTATVSPKLDPTSIGIVIYSNDVEAVWNTLRLANYSKKEGDEVSFFLLGKGVEVDKLVTENKNVDEQVKKLLASGVQYWDVALAYKAEIILPLPSVNFPQ